MASLSVTPQDLLKYCRSELRNMLLCLRQAVVIESPSHSKVDVDRMARFFARQFERCQGKVRILSHRSAGSAVQADFFAQSANRKDPILLLGHTDTVWDRGALA